MDELDIPDEQWEAFEKYCDKHPLRSVRDIWNRRRRFKKYLRKARYKKYSPRRLRMYDPMYAASAMDAKEMLKSIKEIGKQNELNHIGAELNHAHSGLIYCIDKHMIIRILPIEPLSNLRSQICLQKPA